MPPGSGIGVRDKGNEKKAQRIKFLGEKEKNKRKRTARNIRDAVWNICSGISGGRTRIQRGDADEHDRSFHGAVPL